MLENLQLLVKPVGAACNQACAYCFYRRTDELQPAGGAQCMSADLLDQVIRKYLRLRLPQSVFCWQGGEPTLAGLDFYRNAVALMSRHGAGGQRVSNAFQTNGALLDADWCRFFAQYRFLIGLSLDGPPELHDAYRRTTRGEATYCETCRAMKLLRESQVEFNVLSVVTDRLAPNARAVYRHFRELGLTHLQFIPCLETDAAGAPLPFSVAPEAYADFLCELFDLWLPEAKSGVSVRLFDALLSREVTGAAGLCDLDGACASYLVIERNGDAYPCDFFVQPEMRLGNVAAMPIEKLLERPAARRLRQARGHLPGYCAGCDWKDLCRGGCLKDRQRIGAMDSPTYFCKTWKRFFAHAAEPLRKLGQEWRQARGMT